MVPEAYQGRSSLLSQKPVRANYKVASGDSISVHVPEPEILDVKPENIPLDILYEDDDVLLINKPKDMVVHPAPGHPDHTVVNAVMYHCRDQLSGINGVLRPGIVHRIDKDTTGVIVICKNDRAHLSLGRPALRNIPSQDGTRPSFITALQKMRGLSMPLSAALPLTGKKWL